MAARLDQSRQRVLEICMNALLEQGRALLQTDLRFDYRRGWARDRELLQALEDGLDRDRQLGATQSGPHRAELAVRYDERQARKLVSRGQQKLLASAMILAATETAQAAIEKPLLLLLDDPAAELDGNSVERLMLAVAALGCQVIVTSLDSGALRFPDEPRLFHVEHGDVLGADDNVSVLAK